jgi:thioredoxin 2
MSDSIHIVCPSCNGTNKIPSNSDTPKCGRCKHELFDTTPIDLDTENYNQHLEKNDIPVVVDFWAPWCGPCQSMAPNFKQAAQSFQGKVRFAKLNTESQQSIAAEKSIRSIPTLILYKNGHEVDRVSGALDTQNLIQWIKSKS